MLMTQGRGNVKDTWVEHRAGEGVGGYPLVKLVGVYKIFSVM